MEWKEQNSLFKRVTPTETRGSWGFTEKEKDWDITIMFHIAFLNTRAFNTSGSMAVKFNHTSFTI